MILLTIVHHETKKDVLDSVISIDVWKNDASNTVR